MYLYFIRHGQSENNALWDQTKSSEGRKSDPNLTEIGVKQAEFVANFLLNQRVSNFEEGNGYQRKGFYISHIYTSLMHRAVATADVIASRLNLSYFGHLDLHEWGGIYLDDPETKSPKSLPGNPRTFFEENFPKMILPEGLNNDGWWNRPYETRDETQKRAERLLWDLRIKHGDKNDGVVLVSHGGFFNNLISTIFNLGMRDQNSNSIKGSWFTLNNTGMARIDFVNNEAALIFTNYLDFLPTSLIT